jgi:hypothetical protein
MNGFARSLLIVGALILAALAGIAFVVLVAVTGGIGRGSLDAFAGLAIVVWFLAFFGQTTGSELLPLFGMLVAMVIVLPLAMPGAVVAILAEAFGWRSMTVHVSANAGVSALVGGTLGLARAFNDPQRFPSGEANALLLMAATGAIVGFVYWLIAGRTASGFLARRPPAPPQGSS